MSGAAECLSIWKMDEMSRKFQGRREHFAKKFGDGLSVPEGTYRSRDASSMGRSVQGRIVQGRIVPVPILNLTLALDYFR
jgi:hypothetical protein